MSELLSRLYLLEGSLLKRPENLTDNQRMGLRELLGYNLKSVRAYLLKEQFQGGLKSEVQHPIA